MRVSISITHSLSAFIRVHPRFHFLFRFIKWMKSRHDAYSHSKTLRLGAFDYVQTEWLRLIKKIRKSSWGVARVTYSNSSCYLEGQFENQISETGAAVGMAAIDSSILGLILCSTASTATRMAFFTATPVEDPWAMMTTPLTPSRGLPP